MQDEPADPARSPEELVNLLWKALQETGEVTLAMIRVYGEDEPYSNFPQLRNTYTVWRQDGNAYEGYCPVFLAMNIRETTSHDQYEDAEGGVTSAYFLQTTKFIPQASLPLYFEGPGVKIQIGTAAIDETGLITMEIDGDTSVADRINLGVSSMSFGFTQESVVSKNFEFGPIHYRVADKLPASSGATRTCRKPAPERASALPEKQIRNH